DMERILAVATLGMADPTTTATKCLPGAARDPGWPGARLRGTATSGRRRGPRRGAAEPAAGADGVRRRAPALRAAARQRTRSTAARRSAGLVPRVAYVPE